MTSVAVDPGDVRAEAEGAIAPRLVAGRQLAQCTEPLRRRAIEPRPVKGLPVRVRVAPEQDIVDQDYRSARQAAFAHFRQCLEQQELRRAIFRHVRASQAMIRSGTSISSLGNSVDGILM